MANTFLDMLPPRTLAYISRGPQIRRLIAAGEIPFVEVEPLRFFRVTKARNGGVARVVAW